MHQQALLANSLVELSILHPCPNSAESHNNLLSRYRLVHGNHVRHRHGLLQPDYRMGPLFSRLVVHLAAAVGDLRQLVEHGVVHASNGH